MKRVVITGVSRGLGLAMAEQLIEKGHYVCGCARSADQIRRLQQKHGQPHQWHAVDVRDDAAVCNWSTEILAAGAPDLLVNNAGVINRNAPLWNVPADEMQLVFDVNIQGIANVIRHFVPAMIERGSGVIVNFSSTWGRTVSAEVAPYCASKWAVEGLTRALADELPSGLTAVPLNPGVIHTDMLESCFGEHADAYPAPADWAVRAVELLSNLGPKDNGQPLTV